MSADLAPGASDADGAVDVPPPLTPTLVADPHHVDELVRSSRATLAMLTLELRAAEREADDVERVVGQRQATDAGMPGAGELFDATLDDWVAGRRAEIADEVEQAHAEAARVVATARSEAAGWLAQAHAQLVRELADRISRSAPPTAVAPVYPVPVPPAPVAPLRPTAPSSAARWARFLVADVVLPLVAVVIVIVVLLAWLG